MRTIGEISGLLIYGGNVRMEDICMACNLLFRSFLNRRTFCATLLIHSMHIWSAYFFISNKAISFSSRIAPLRRAERKLMQ